MANLKLATTDVASVVNSLVDNLTGVDLVNEDLSNIADFGKAVNALSQNDILDNMSQFVKGISATYYDMRMGEKRTLGLRRTREQFAGIIQRVKMELLKAESTDIYNLKKYSTTQKVYDRGLKYEGHDFDVRAFVKNVSYRVVHQISYKTYISSINDKNSIMSLVAMIEATAQKTLDTEEYALELAMVSAMIAGAKANEVALLTMYKTDVDTSYTKTPEQALEDPIFKRWAGEVIAEIQSYALDPNKTYNDGSITTYVPASELKTILLTKFAKKYAFNVESDTFNMGKVSLKVDHLVNAWNGTDGKLYPKLAEVGKIDVTLEGEDEPTVIENVIGVTFDEDACVYAEIDETVTSDWNGDGAFTTIYDNHLGDRIIDPRNTAIVFTLN